MLLTHLEYFEALARERHFGRAAAACFITTSTMSEAVRKLEAEVGVPLVNRGKSSYQGLTAEGELFLSHSRQLLADYRRLMEDLTAAGGSLETTVRIGVIPSGHAVAADVLARLIECHPAVEVAWTSGLSSEQLVARLHSHELDAAVIHPAAPLTDGLDITDTAPVRYAVVLTDSLPLASGGTVSDREYLTGADLVHLPLALLNPDMHARVCFDRAMVDAGVPVTPSAQADSVGALVALAATGRWAAVVPEETPGATSASLRTLPLIDPVVELPTAVARLSTTPVSVLGAALDAAGRTA